MTWMKLDTLVRSNRKLAATITETGNANAAWLWLLANAYCRDELTDGFLPEFMIPTLVPGFTEKILKPLPAVLVRHGLWHVAEGGYQVNDFLHYNPTKVEIEEKRQQDRQRKRGGSAKDSARNPEGVASDSVPRGRESAGARTSASLSSDDGSTSVIERTPEGGPGGTAHCPPLPRRSSVVDRAGALGLLSPGAWERQHGSHALRVDLCDWVCLPVIVHDEWQRRLVAAGATAEDAARDIRMWALDVRAQWAGRVPGDDIFAFWRNEWAKQHGSNRPSSTPKAGAGLDALIGGLRG